MVFKKPSVEFVTLIPQNAIATSDYGPAYVICERQGDTAIQEAHFCLEMGNDAEATYATICGSAPKDKSLGGHIVP